MIKAAEEIFRLQKENQKLKEGIKQAREKLDEMSKYTSVTNVTHYRQLNRDDVLSILDKLIKESEEVNE